MKTLLIAVASVLVAAVGQAGPGVRVVVSADPCLIMPCPIHPPPPTVTMAGGSFGIFVTTQDSGGGNDSGFTGTVTFASTDTFATLPPSYNFLAGDQGGKGFTAVLRTPGVQTITVSDPTGRLLPGTLQMTVTGGAAQPVPTLSVTGKILFGILLILAAVWTIRNFA